MTKHTIRTALLLANRNEDDSFLADHGIVAYKDGAMYLTALGRRIQSDLIFAGKDGTKEDILTVVRDLHNKLEAEVSEQ